MTGYVLSIDAETNGLGGDAFAVAMTLYAPDGTEIAGSINRSPISGVVDPWVDENVLPVIGDIPTTCDSYEGLLDLTRNTLSRWKAEHAPTVIAHVAWPVEARLLLDMFPGNRVWDGPFPLIDVASVLHAKGFDPLSVDNYLTEHGIPLPKGSPHNPIYDCRAAHACYRHLMEVK